VRFEDKQLTPAAYRYAFLIFTDEIAPEVLETLKTLAPKYKEIFGKFDYHNSMKIFDCIIAHQAEDANYILFELGENSRHYEPNALIANDNVTLKNFLEFRQGFYEFIERFGLKTEWLKQDLFGLLHGLSEKPQYYNKLALATAFGWSPYIGKPLQFEFDGWQIEYDSKDFEKTAIAAFRNYLREYITTTANQAKTDGYKLIRRKRNIGSVRWLVWWTVKRLSKEEIIERIEKERSQKKGEETYIDISTINKAFLKFKKFGLPVRKE
jgi:hypothetical protein